MSLLTCALGPDSAGTLLTAMLRDARSSIDAAVYEVGPSYAWVLTEAVRRGVRVRLLLDDHPSDGNASTARDLVRSGGECRVLGGGAPSAHWKLLVVDGAKVAVGTGNLVWRDAPRDRRGRLPPQADELQGTREWWGLGAEAPRLALQALDGFDTAWQRAAAPPDAWLAVPRAEPGDVGAPSPEVAPLTVRVTGGGLRLVLGGMPVATALVSLIGAARRRALATAPYIHPHAAGVQRLVAALRSAMSRGVDTRLLLGARPEPADLAWLRAAVMPVRWMDATVSTRGHAKGLIADDVAVITSANWSSAGCGRNWEAALLARSAAAAGYYAAAWHRDWEAAVPVASLVSSVRTADMLPAWSLRTSDR